MPARAFAIIVRPRGPIQPIKVGSESLKKCAISTFGDSRKTFIVLATKRADPKVLG